MSHLNNGARLKTMSLLSRNESFDFHENLRNNDNDVIKVE